MLEEQWTIKNLVGASLMVQWLKICLLMRGHRVKPWSERIPPAKEQQNLWATTTRAHELHLLKPETPQPRLQQARLPQPASGPLLSTAREGPHPRPETQHGRNKKTNPVE